MGEWIKFDPEGNGFISYRDFWSFCTTCAEKLGITYDQIMSEDKPGNTILSQLNIPVWQNKNKQIFVYRFHDVIIALTKFSIYLKTKSYE